MSGKFLLDTNIVIALFARESPVQQHLSTAEEVFAPSIVLGELYYGARKSVHVEANTKRIDEFAASVSVLPCNSVTAQHYGVIKNHLRVKGRPLPENDIWIAAVARQYSLVVVSRDEHYPAADQSRLYRLRLLLGCGIAARHGAP